MIIVLAWDVDARLDDRRETRMSASRRMNLSITSSSSRGGICPCPTTIRASGASRRTSSATVDVVDAVVHEEHLPLARELAEHRLLMRARRRGSPR
jgi:hypothetical protein